MKYYLENSRIVLRGKTSQGKPYRLFVKDNGNVLTLEPKQSWNQEAQKITGKNSGSLNTYIDGLKARIRELIRTNSIYNPAYSVPDAWAELFPSSKQAVEKLSNKIVECIDPYLKDNSGSKSAGYLRHYAQLKTELAAWNKSVQFDNLNELTLSSYLQYLKGEGTPTRKALKSSTIGHHFKHLRQVAKYVSQRGVKVDPAVYDFSPGKVVYSAGCFDLTYDELMILWHYKPANKYEEIVLDHSLFEAFTGIRTGDIYSLKEDGSEHGVKIGDISAENIGYRDRKNNDMVKYVTRHKFNERFIEKYMKDDSNSFLLPPVSQQAANRIIKDICRKVDLTRGIRRGSDIKPLHEVVASHCFRASYGNLLYRQGVTSEMVAEELGHAAANVTIKHYLKFSNRHELIREKMNALEIFQPQEKNILKKAV
jgi:integrase